MDKLQQWVAQLAGQRVVVVGDVFLDEYLTGRAERLSREAPIPVLEFTGRQHIPGGAGNPAANIVGLGSAALQVGVVGADAAAELLRAALVERHIDASGLVTDATRPTTVKMRLMALTGLRFPHQVARLDTLSRQPISTAVADQIMTVVRTALATAPRPTALLVSDYRTGLLTPELVQALRAAATGAGVLLTADSQGQFEHYHGFALVKCNADEAQAYLGRPLATDDEFATAAAELRERLALSQAMVITRGAQGATAATPHGAAHYPAPAVTDVYDTVGAGDTTIAVLTLALGAGAPLATAVLLANYASGLVVRKVGNYAPTPDELRGALAH